MAGRFIKLYEKMLSWEWYHDINTFRLFIHLLLKANYKDTNWKGIVILRGQLVTSLPSLASQTGLTTRQVRVSLDKLKMTGEVADKVTNRYRLITIVKYDEYQSDGRQNGSQTADKTAGKRQADDRQMTGKCQTNDRQMTADIDNIEYIEQVDIIEQVEHTPPARETDEGFDFFWNAYPKKTAKQDALKAWKKLKPDHELLGKILSGLSKWIASDDWKRDGGRFIPYPSTWLNGRRWEDEVPQSSPAPVKSVPQRRPSSADNFEQRDYSDVPMDDMAKLKADIEAFRRGDLS